MAASLKTKGREELDSLLRRVRRQFAMGRIGATDCEFIERHLVMVGNRISEMQEVDSKGRLIGADEASDNIDLHPTTEETG